MDECCHWQGYGKHCWKKHKVLALRILVWPKQLTQHKPRDWEHTHEYSKWQKIWTLFCFVVILSVVLLYMPYDVHVVLLSFDWFCCGVMGSCGFILCIFPYSAQLDMSSVFTRGQFWPSGIVVACICLPMYVSFCMSIMSLSVRKLFQSRTTKYGQKMHNTLIKSLLFWRFIDLNLQGQI